MRAQVLRKRTASKFTRYVVEQADVVRRRSLLRLLGDLPLVDPLLPLRVRLLFRVHDTLLLTFRLWRGLF